MNTPLPAMRMQCQCVIPEDVIPEQLKGEGEEKERERKGRREERSWSSGHRESVAWCNQK